MRMTQQSIGTIVLAMAAALFCSGCPALIIPSLAYQGYKYEHNKNETAANTSSTQNNQPARLDAAKDSGRRQHRVADSAALAGGAAGSLTRGGEIPANDGENRMPADAQTHVTSHRADEKMKSRGN